MYKHSMFKCFWYRYVFKAKLAFDYVNRYLVFDSFNVLLFVVLDCAYSGFTMILQ